MKHNIFYSKSLGTEYTLEESPRCLDSDPLSHQPTAIDPNFLFPHDACRFFFSAFFLFSPVYFGSWVVPLFFSLWSVAALLCSVVWQRPSLPPQLATSWQRLAPPTPILDRPPHRSSALFFPTFDDLSRHPCASDRSSIVGLAREQLIPIIQSSRRSRLSSLLFVLLGLFGHAVVFPFVCFARFRTSFFSIQKCFFIDVNLVI